MDKIVKTTCRLGVGWSSMTQKELLPFSIFFCCCFLPYTGGKCFSHGILSHADGIKVSVHLKYLLCVANAVCTVHCYHQKSYTGKEEAGG